jgi:histone-lysine N-methyltransferase SUV39H
MNTPYIAFVATQDIPPRTELTFDYDPAASRAKAKGKGKAKAKIPSGAKRCRCDAEECRGWVKV